MEDLRRLKRSGVETGFNSQSIGLGANLIDGTLNDSAPNRGDAFEGDDSCGRQEMNEGQADKSGGFSVMNK